MCKIRFLYKFCILFLYQENCTEGNKYDDKQKYYLLLFPFLHRCITGHSFRFHFWLRFFVRNRYLFCYLRGNDILMLSCPFCFRLLNTRDIIVKRIEGRSQRFLRGLDWRLGDDFVVGINRRISHHELNCTLSTVLIRNCDCLLTNTNTYT